MGNDDAGNDRVDRKFGFVLKIDRQLKENMRK